MIPKMRQSNLVYNKDKDIAEVDQFGYVDLRQAFENGYVPGDTGVVDENFNDIDDPRSIVGKPGDAFEAMRMQDKIVEYVKSSSAKSAPAKESAKAEK